MHDFGCLEFEIGMIFKINEFYTKDKSEWLIFDYFSIRLRTGITSTLISVSYFKMISFRLLNITINHRTRTVNLAQTTR